MTDASSSWFGPVENMPGAWQGDTGHSSFVRLWHAFMSARITIASVLVVLQAVVYALGNVSNRWSIGICVVYLLATVAVRLRARPKPPASTFDAQWVLTIGVDVITFSALNFLQAGGINYTPLFALPVLLASVLGPLLLALGTAASVTLILLVEAWGTSFGVTGDMAPRFLQSGLSGSGFFAVALLANQLAIRLAREEQLAKNSQLVARMQTRVNQLVIETLTDGVLVIDVNGVVRSANPASRHLLALPKAARMAPFELATEAAWQPLSEFVRLTFLLRIPQQADVHLQFPLGAARRLHVRTRLTGSHGDTGESLCVVFLEDLREMEARVRTEKMAAMGRMSAAVAHEIRNPLAAISQANALLEEDLSDPAHRQLTTMVRQNSLRLAKIVDEILNISRVQVVNPEDARHSLMLDAAATRDVAEWMQQNVCGNCVLLRCDAPAVLVPFDPEHLRRIMVNLLDNALRYASGTPASIRVTTNLMGPDQARLSVWSDGKPLETSVRSHLFEPFFSSESRSSGLGLYICRELCERYGAVMTYQRASHGRIEGNEFYVTFRYSNQVVPSPAASVDLSIA
jgi:two-component system sensor histidine kinase PilS (NtrC family)